MGSIMASIVDVAKHAKVSIATVSRTLNNDSSVAPATAKLVREAAQALGYIPRAVRPGPKPAKRKGVNSGAIAFVSIGMHEPSALYSLPALPAFLGGIQRGVIRHGMELVLAHMPDEKTIPPVLARRRADGILLFFEEPLTSSLKEFVSRKIDCFGDVPIVYCLRGIYDKKNSYDHVMYDNAKIGPMAADYLIERGCRRLFFASSEANHAAYAQRREQFLAVCSQKGLQVTVVEGVESFEPAHRLKVAEELVEKLSGANAGDRPGVFCASDDLMMAVYNKLHQRNIEPGRDVELIGCNNDPVIMSQMHPRPATIDIKFDAVGERAVDQLFWRMSHRDDHNQMELFISPELVPAEMPAVRAI